MDNRDITKLYGRINDIFIDKSLFPSANKEKFQASLELVLKEILLTLDYFDNAFLLKEVFEFSNVYKIISMSEHNSPKVLDIPENYFINDELLIPDEFTLADLKNKLELWRKIKTSLDLEEGIITIPNKRISNIASCPITLLISPTNESDIYQILTHFNPDIKIGYAIAMKLRSNCIIILILTSSNFNRIEKIARMEKVINVLSRFMAKDFEVAFYSQRLMEDKKIRDAFLTTSAHSLGMPITSILADTANILEELNEGTEIFDMCKHLFFEVQTIQLIVQNLLHGAGEQTNQQIVYSKKPVLPLLKDACLMFNGEAKDKECDIQTYISMNGCIIKVNLNDLDNKGHIYYRIFYEPLLMKQGIITKNWDISDIDAVMYKKNNEELYIDPIKLPDECFRILHEGSQSIHEKVLIELSGREIWLNIKDIARWYFPDVEMVQEEISLAFKNLIHNAVKYSFRKAYNSGNRFVKVIAGLNDAGYEISIQNYGVGIEKYEIDEGLIFKPRYRGVNSIDRNRTGAGLGLSHVAKSIKRIHKGEIFVTSAPKGFKDITKPNYLVPHLTTFVIRLPLSQSK